MKASKYAPLASDLDLDKIIMLLKQRDITGATEILNTFQDKEPRIASIAANNLSFLSYLVRIFQFPYIFFSIALYSATDTAIPNSKAISTRQRNGAKMPKN